ncbi:hypothetical protein [Flavobacterium sp. ACN2]|uniref:hypothetical protein n=1 Tax=Flavobacterium sp. ACN2 TaxID=1975676 RepID=UPI000BB2FC08|nr:hypothetical protein [Flavobacterium sp. ACN2]
MPPALAGGFLFIAKKKALAKLLRLVWLKPINIESSNLQLKLEAIHFSHELANKIQKLQRSEIFIAKITSARKKALEERYNIITIEFPRLKPRAISKIYKRYILFPYGIKSKTPPIGGVFF